MHRLPRVSRLDVRHLSVPGPSRSGGVDATVHVQALPLAEIVKLVNVRSTSAP